MCPDLFAHWVVRAFLVKADCVYPTKWEHPILLTTLEILLTIVAPLLGLYLRGQWPLRTVTACMLGIAVAWYLTYAPVHELSHAAATVLAGGRVLDVKLIPSFWEGTFAVAWVTTAGLDQPWQQLAMGGAPYVVDVVCVIVSLVALRRRPSVNALVVGLLFMLLCLRPTFDLVCETIGFVGGYRGDLWHVESIVGSASLGSFLLVSLALCLLSVVVILRRYGGPPESAMARVVALHALQEPDDQAVRAPSPDALHQPRTRRASSHALPCRAPDSQSDTPGGGAPDRCWARDYNLHDPDRGSG